MLAPSNRREVCPFWLNLFLALSFPSFAAAPSIEVRHGAQGNVITLLPIGQFHSTFNQVENQRVVQVPNSRVLLALWEERTASGQRLPFYAISLDGERIWRLAQTSYELLMRQERFDPKQRPPFVARLLGSTDHHGIYVVQFVTQPLEEYRQQLRRLGGTLYNYLAHHAYIVKLTADARAQVEQLPFVRSVVPYHPAFRLEEEVLSLLSKGQGLGLTRYNIQIFERGPFQKALLAERIRGLGGKIDSAIPEGFLLQATLTPRQLERVVAWPEVAFIDRWRAPENDYDIAREISGADFVERVAGFSGAGVRGEVLDDGLLTTHMDFVATPPLFHGAPGVGGHGTNTFGIIFGDGTGNPRARGTIPSAQGIAARYSVPGFNRYAHTAELIQDPYFAVFQSNSWGSGLTTQYEIASANMDDILFINDIVLTQSQSNAGTQLSRPEAWAKNIVSVGGIRHLGTLTMDDDFWQGASIGPAADGRIKPDLAHFYDQVITTSSSSINPYTTSFGGTSAATPIVAGDFGLFFEMWHNGIFGNRTADTVFNSRPHMATAKAVLINTATQWTFSGRTHNLTRTHQGWGLPDLQSLYNLRNEILIVDETDVLQDLETRAYAVTVAGAGPPLKATLVYKDLPGTPSSLQHRINDLTLKLTSPSGLVYWGNNGLLDEMWSTPGGEPDTKNTVENVFIENPEPGSWTVEVIASEIVQDSHLQTPEIDADYALVVSGIIR
jgi:hypothetical protein